MSTATPETIRKVSIHVSFGDNTNSQEDTTTTTTHKFSVYKHAAGSEGHLADAVFELKKAGAVVDLIKMDDNNYRVAKSGETRTVTTFTTVASGDIVIWGVDADSDYALKETQAPAGYNKLTAEVAVTVDAVTADAMQIEPLIVAPIVAVPMLLILLLMVLFGGKKSGRRAK